MNSIKTAYAVLISMAAGMPLVVWLLLGESGALGAFGDSEGYSIIRMSLFLLTCVFYFVVSPFILWPRIFNGDDKGEADSDRS
jgi:hypothetical protein